jgi:release factor glutamine methyltransferase
LKPLYDEGYWEHFVETNRWAWEFFPSSKSQLIQTEQRSSNKQIIETILNYLGAGFLNSLVFVFRGKRLQKMRNSGILKGEYTFRHLKANDSRSGLIAALRLKSSLEKLEGSSHLLDDLIAKRQVVKVERNIQDCIPESYREAIESFVQYLQSAGWKKGRELNPDEVLYLPFGVRTDKSLWKIRANNFKKAMSLVRSLETESSGPVLDLGAGNCWLSKYLMQNGYETVSMDPMLDSQNGLIQGDIFEQKNNVRLNRVRGISQQMPFKDGCFKGIIASGSFHYTDNQSATLREMARILDQDSWAIIYDSPVFKSSESGERMVESKIIEFSNESQYQSLKYKPIWYVNLPKFISDAENLGFRVEIISTRSWLQNLADRIKNRILSKRAWAEFPIIVLRKGFTQRSEIKTSFIRTLRSLYFRQFTEPKLIPGREFVIDGIKLVVPSEVFNPLPFDSSRILLSEIRQSHSDLKNKIVLDMGCGTGIHAIQCAKFGADVTAVDINQSAVECATSNVQRNREGERIKILQGDLFEPVENEKYDLILFNPPYYKGDVTNPSDHAWKDKDGETLDRFICELPDHLTWNGYALLIISDRMDLNLIKQKCSESRIKYETIRQKRVWDETYFIVRLTREEPHEV